MSSADRRSSGVLLHTDQSPSPIAGLVRLELASPSTAALPSRAAEMAEKPLEGLESISQKLDQRSSTESLRLQLCQYSRRGGRQARNWVSFLSSGTSLGWFNCGSQAVT